MQLQKALLELHALETTWRNVQGNGWKTIASGVREHPPARRWQGEFKNQSAKSGGESHFIRGTPLWGLWGLRDHQMTAPLGCRQRGHTPGHLHGHIPKEAALGQGGPKPCFKHIKIPNNSSSNHCRGDLKAAGSRAFVKVHREGVVAAFCSVSPWNFPFPEP